MDPKIKHWLKTQQHWNDDEFLAVTANAFMKLRWKRLSLACAAEAARAGKPVDVVDLGCAHADFCAVLGDRAASYTGVEPSKALLPKNVARGKRFRLLRGQAEKLPLKAACADFVLLKEVLDHCYDPARVLSEARRVLRPGGKLVITLTNDHAWYKRLFPAAAERIKATQHDHLYFFHPDQVLDLATKAGFSRMEERSSHYLRLPYALEGILGRLPEPLGFALISLSDALGSLIAPGYGGSFWVVAVK